MSRISWTFFSRKRSLSLRSNRLKLLSSPSGVVALCSYNGKAPGFYTSGQRVINNDCSSAIVWKPNSGTSIPLGYTNWYPGEPNCYGSIESCLGLYAGFNYQWNDLSCTLTQCPICKIDTTFWLWHNAFVRTVSSSNYYIHGFLTKLSSTCIIILTSHESAPTIQANAVYHLRYTYIHNNT